MKICIATINFLAIPTRSPCRLAVEQNNAAQEGKGIGADKVGRYVLLVRYHW
ncbi:hypothetical protein NB693_25230 [Pantoea ananatis]|nr:hypothetical protein [Pantoea ananatis]